LAEKAATQAAGEQTTKAVATAKAKAERTILRMRDISIVIDTYEDIFSDFDPRSYSERRVSKDFLEELRLACRENPEGAPQVRIVVPDKLRNEEVETVIVGRLNAHFQREIKRLDSEAKEMRLGGIKFMAISAPLLLVYSVLEQYSFLKPLGELLAFCGYVLGFAGSDNLFFKYYPLKKERELMERMERAEFIFIPKSIADSKQNPSSSS